MWCKLYTGILNANARCLFLKIKMKKKKEIGEKNAEAQISSGLARWNRICKDIKIKLRKRR